MNTIVGQNTPSSQLLRGFVERVEAIRLEKKELAAGEAVVLAEAKAAGFDAKTLRTVIQRRSMKPHARAEAEALLDTYLHALGDQLEFPLFRQVALLDVDVASRESVIEAMKRFCPEGGSITVEAGGNPVRLTRNKDGEITVTEVVERAPAPEDKTKPAKGPKGRAAKPAPPDVDEAGAEALGRQAFKDNVAIIANPFPFADPRRARWDEGWRAESGGDGMGPK